MFFRIMRTVVNVIPYMISGFSAPFIFRAAATPQVGGHYAGALFIFAGFWAVGLSFRHEYPLWARVAAISVLVLNAFFWSWRFGQTRPLKESMLLGISGSAWHGTLTGFYLMLLVILLVFEFKLSPP